ncbi:DUF3102 domain-containing protein [uncultured Anaerococcus sp.]|uniref:DUF3102 domain-containing protein n=1 Tax=uncultured Anaerococcus sp. TaxID=293428 RepID=UPI00288991CB|nr:DUF3102 domain-containing protein [uncultured Anaerococcus sp.]
MNELSSLNQIVSEIKFFENQATESFWEIGKRLSQAKEMVDHGEWMNWVEENLGYSQRTTNEIMRVYKEFPNSRPYANLSFKKVLALTSIKDEEDRQDFIENNDVENKSVRELTQTIKDYKDNIKAKDEEIESLKNRPPEIIEKEIVKEIKSGDYEYQKERAERLEKDLLNEKMKNQKLAEDKKLAISKLEINEANKEILSQINSLQYTVLGFLHEVGGLLYLTEYLDKVPKDNRDVFLNSIRHLREFSEQIYKNCENYFRK